MGKNSLLNRVEIKYRYTTGLLSKSTAKPGAYRIVTIHSHQDCYIDVLHLFSLYPRSSQSLPFIHVYKIGTTPTSTQVPTPLPGGISSGPVSLRKPFVGLSNQGATCYMNSLLQTLFMTPDLRQRMYRWTFQESEESKKEDSIPYQLQLLFGRLQLSQQSFVDTRGLTKSFQWDSRESFTQHDVQEFCRVLFDAIERSVKGTSQENIINELYQGVLIDYVKCQACGTESHREDHYLDVSLAVRNEQDRIYNDSLEKALDTFVRPETLTGANQYQCEKCNSKQNAIKGLRFKSFPKIFVIQLKRFDLDYRTMMKKKINDFVSFPQILNLNAYTSDVGKKTQAGENSNTTATTESALPSDLEARAMKYARPNKREVLLEDKDKPALELDKIAQSYAAKYNSRLLREARQRKIADYLELGEHVYELYSIMVHSGSALGGHYYAYIKSFEDDRWYMFNDSNVREVSEEELKLTYGGTEGRGWSNTSANAYLLVYRKVSPEGLMRVDDLEVPAYIQESMVEDQRRELEETQNRAERLKHMVIRVYYQGQDKTFNISRERKLKDLIAQSIQEYKLEDVPLENLRLRAYLPQQDAYLESYTGQEESTLESLKITNYKSLALERKEPGEQFQEFDPMAVMVKVVLWDDATSGSDSLTLAEKAVNPKRLQINKSAKLQELMEKIQEMTGIEVGRQVLLRKTYMTASTQADLVSQISNLKRPLHELRINDSTVLYLEALNEEQKQYKWAKEFDLESYRILIKFNHPDDPPTSAPYDLKHKLVIDNRAHMRDLKEKISRALDLPMDSFFLRRGYAKSGPEIKDMDMKLNFANMMTGTSVFVERGIQTKADECRISVTVTGAPKTGSTDGTCFSLFDLVQVTVNTSKSVREVKELIASKSNLLYPSLNLSPNFFYLREQIQDRLGRALREGDRLREYQPVDNKQLCAHCFPTEIQELRVKEIIIACKQWKPSTWELTDPVHIIVDKTWTQFEFGERLAELYQLPIDNLELAKIIYLPSFVRTELTKETWIRLVSKKDKVDAYPLSLLSDGYLLIVKDRTETRKQLTEEEMKQFSNTQNPNTKNAGQTSYWSYEKRKEKSMVIKVKGEKTEEERL